MIQSMFLMIGNVLQDEEIPITIEHSIEDIGSSGKELNPQLLISISILIPPRESGSNTD